MQKLRMTVVGALCLTVALSVAASAKVTVAMNPLSGFAGVGEQREAVSVVMQAELSQSETIELVDRQEMMKVLGELKLAEQGMLATQDARRLARMVTAKYFCSGALTQAGDKIMVTARVINVQTTVVKLVYELVSSADDPVKVGKVLARKVEETVAQFEIEDKKEIVPSKAKEIPPGWRRPTVMVIIREMHVRQPRLIDPAGETEIVKRLIAAGFRVIDSEYVTIMKADQKRPKKRFRNLKTSTQYAADRKVNVLLYGEAVSERAARLGDFEGCRARVELKAIDVKTDEVLVSQSAEGGATDLAETVAGKKAIQQAANRLADTFLYSLAKKWGRED